MFCKRKHLVIDQFEEKFFEVVTLKLIFKQVTYINPDKLPTVHVGGMVLY